MSKADSVSDEYIAKSFLRKAKEQEDYFLTHPQNVNQDTVDESNAGWDSLQGGYQDIVDICEEARVRLGSGLQRPTIFHEPERKGRLGGSKLPSGANLQLGIMPPPVRFSRTSRASEK